MKSTPRLLLRAYLTVVVFAASIALAAPTDDVYKLGPDSEVQPGVPQGKLTGWSQLPSTAYPGTLHDYCVFVPAQYDPAKPAALMIFQDGQAFTGPKGDYRVPNVFNNLIYRREIPVTIAVFINPGRKPEQPVASSSDWGDRSTNRPQEYNALDDKYARVIVEELLPALAKEYNLSSNPNDRAIGGHSSGATAGERMTLTSACGTGQVMMVASDVPVGEYFLEMVDAEGAVLSGTPCPPPDTADTASYCVDYPVSFGGAR